MTEKLTMPQVILVRLGGSKFLVSHGISDARAYGHGIRMTLPRGKRVRYVTISHTRDDLYTVVFSRMRGLTLEHEIVATVHDVKGGDLTSCFETTLTIYA